MIKIVVELWLIGLPSVGDLTSVAGTVAFDSSAWRLRGWDRRDRYCRPNVCAHPVHLNDTFSTDEYIAAVRRVTPVSVIEAQNANCLVQWLL